VDPRNGGDSIHTTNRIRLKGVAGGETRNRETCIIEEGEDRIAVVWVEGKRKVRNGEGAQEHKGVMEGG